MPFVHFLHVSIPRSRHSEVLEHSEWIPPELGGHWKPGERVLFKSGTGLLSAPSYSNMLTTRPPAPFDGDFEPEESTNRADGIYEGVGLGEHADFHADRTG